MESANRVAIVNLNQCRVLGLHLSTVTFRPEFLRRPFLVSYMPHELRGRMFYFAVAICHQTYALENRALNLYGWDYLEAGFLKMAGLNPRILDPAYLVDLTTSRLADELAPYFSADGSSDLSTLDRREERATLMKQAAFFIHKFYRGSFSDFLASTGGCLKGRPEAYYEQLKQVSPFADPLYKKSTFLLKLLVDARLFNVSDVENIVPVMDYHMQRVLLRTGCVEIPDRMLFDNLTNRRELPDDKEVREASVDAMKIIAGFSGLNPLLMNDVFYMLGRSCCLDEPMCVSHHCAKEPCSLTLTLLLQPHDKCLFTSLCRGEADEAYRKLWHPVVATHYY